MRALSTWINGFIGSAKSTGKTIINSLGKAIPEMYEYFASDFGGYGWKIFEDELNKFTLEIDNIRVRGTFVAHELVIDKIRAIAGSIGISQSCGRVKSVDTKSDSQYILITMEGDETHGYGGFMANDFIRCQRLTSNGIKGYWVKVYAVNGKILKVAKSEFSKSGIVVDKGNGYDFDHVENSTNDMLYPAEGDEIVQYGNSQDAKRQSAIYIHANGEGQPSFDILEGVKTKSFNGCLTCRLGGGLPNGGGFGLFTKRGYIVSKDGDKINYEISPNGTFNLANGAIVYKDNKLTISKDAVIEWGASSQEEVEYALSTDGVTPPTSGWTTLSKISSDKGGKYLWTRTRYPNGTYAYSVSYQAVDGAKGKTTYFHIKYSNDGGKTFTSNNGESVGDWIGVCTDFNVNDPTSVSAYQWSKTKGEKGDKGDKGDQGIKGVDGADGQNMRQNLADYTEFIPEIFEKKPDGITLNGIRKVGLDGCGALYAKCATTKDDVWMFQQNVISRLVPNEWYTISFYAKTDIASSSIAVYMRSGSTNSVVKLNEVGKLDGKDYTIKSEVVTFALSNVFVRHTFTFKTASTLPNNAYLLFRLFGAIKDAYITQVKLERSSVASDWCRSETDKVAAVNLPEWLDTWNGQTTSANAQYVAARNAFFGVRDTNDKYTGIMMSSEGLKINGKSQAIGGLYALSNNEVKIAIDPTKSIYRFQGKVLCDGGQMEGLHVGASLNGITKVNKDNFLGMFSIKRKLSKYYGAPDFYIVNPIIVVESIPTTDTNGNAISGIMLPPYSTGANDYNLALGLLGKTLYIINKSSVEIGINGMCVTSSNYAKYLNGEVMLTISNANNKIASGKAATYTAHINSSGDILWVVESNNGGNVSNIDTNFSVLPPSGNNKWYFDKYTTNGGSGNTTV